MKQLKTHYYRENEYDLENRLQTALGDSHRITVSKKIPGDIEVLVLAYPTKEKLSIAPNLRYLIVPFVGIPEETRVLLQKYPDIKVFNIHHNSRVVAETVMAMLLTGIKHIIQGDREFRTHDWSFRYGINPSTLLYQKRILICGFGHIGKLLASFLEPYQVVIDKIKRNNLDAEQGVYFLADLPNIVENYDIVINILPATEETKQVFDQAVFARMKPSCYFINVGRASTVEESALFSALNEKRIAGAALDVWYNYPISEADRKNTPPANYPFHTLDNVIMSPHRAGGLGMAENEEFRIEELTKLLTRMLNNPDLEGLDLGLGY